jgi:hypothetical protein
MDPVLKRIYAIRKEALPTCAKHLMVGAASAKNTGRQMK